MPVNTDPKSACVFHCVSNPDLKQREKEREVVERCSQVRREEPKIDREGAEGVLSHA